MHCEDSKITNTNSLPCLQMTSIADQNKKNLQKKRRFNLEIQNGSLTIENLFVIILFKSMKVYYSKLYVRFIATLNASFTVK